MKYTSPIRWALAPLLAAMVLAGCATPAAIDTASLPVTPLAFREGSTAVTTTTPALQGPWLGVFADPVLSQLVEQASRSNNTVQIAAARLRLRPILMTSLAFIMGVLPLVLSTGAGAEMRHAMGVAVFFGMIGVTAFGLFLTPVFYVTLRAMTGNRPLKPHGEVPHIAGFAVSHAAGGAGHAAQPAAAMKPHD